MSQQTAYNIRCPKCQHEQVVSLYDSINVQAEPELKDVLLKNELNNVVCGSCDFSFRVDKPLLYNDPGRRCMINLIPATEARYHDAERQFSEWLRDMQDALPNGVETPEMHLVFSRCELVERVFLIEAGLNVRIIEYVKHIVYSRNLERVDPLSKALLFDAQDSTEESLCFVVQDVPSQKLEQMLQYSRQAYNGLCEMFDRDDQTPSLMELFPGPYVNARALFLMDAKVK